MWGLGLTGTYNEDYRIVVSVLRRRIFRLDPGIACESF